MLSSKSYFLAQQVTFFLKKQLKMMFRLLDENQDDKISRDEIKEVLEELQLIVLD